MILAFKSSVYRSLTGLRRELIKVTSRNLFEKSVDRIFVCADCNSAVAIRHNAARGRAALESMLTNL